MAKKAASKRKPNRQASRSRGAGRKPRPRPAPITPAAPPSAADVLAHVDASPRLAAARDFCIEAARLCADRRCRDVRILQVAGLSPVTDYFVLANAVSARQMRSIAREIEELADSRDLAPLGGHPQPNDRWVAVDCVDAIVHLFSEEARLFYDLENLWGDAPQIQWARDDGV